ncbi:hypothetical protein ACFO0N_10475 [Halobium salinum]|uniref:Amphi-Trp domain-containing protein n=1 Tax=Halobium salinum TaxID=1364940 RepID=A0ABD5PD11_9EURY|nr:hypothetical protein [Halobium salinum]
MPTDERGSDARSTAERRRREDRLAAEFERVAAELGSGEAALHGYDVTLDPAHERGGVRFSGGWLRFDLAAEE